MSNQVAFLAICEKILPHLQAIKNKGGRSYLVGGVVRDLVMGKPIKDIDIEVSVLSVPKKIADASAIVLGRDGVIVSDGAFHQGVFLPQVAEETQWGKEEFLNELCSQKAGLPADCWKDPHNSLLTFQAEVF